MSSPDDSGKAPALRDVLETVLYFADQDRAEAFYSGILGLRMLSREPGRALFYRLGHGVLLLFQPGTTRRGGKLPPHGASGSIHVCFRSAPEAYEAWKAHLERRGVAILQEVQWPRGRSFYFEDPDGNLLEIADSDIWPS